MPTYNCEQHLDRVLPPLVQAARDRKVAELIAVDDGSTDNSADLCRNAGFQVMTSGSRCGPGAARNIGSQAASGDIIFFVDSDVVIHDDTIARVTNFFDSHTDYIAVFGSYDDRPAAPGLISRYRNLLHHFVHQCGNEEAITFWAGCGAVRRDAFLEAGGFDAERYPYPSIEDIELGYRLRRNGGRIRLDRSIQGTHLKRWTFANMLFTDICRRGIPWGRLMLEAGYETRDLNVAHTERCRAGLAGLFWLSVAACVWQPSILWLAAALLVVAFYVNARFYMLVRRRFGVVQMLVALALHQLYYFYSVACYLFCLAESLFRKRSRARSTASR
jgi:glycosyltransferase involved in cell wall biosynthesis